jgi:SAM-dependent methyltransferase
MHKEKPAHLGPEYAAQFSDASVVTAYEHRPPYPPEVFEILLSLMTDQPKRVLDLGCGRGEIAREIVGQVDRVDAVDPSAAMIATGQRMPSGDHPQLRWICAKAENAMLEAPYDLAAAGNSLHWMDWARIFPRLEAVLSPRANLALIGVGNGRNPWDEQLRALISRFSTNRDFRPYNLITELETRGCFAQAGRLEAGPLPYQRSVPEYIEAFHSQNGLSRDRMESAAAHAFDTEVQALVDPFSDDGILHLTSVATVIWGRPSTIG